ncbi:MAG: type II toxin-antitoxin system RelE/ParE family toxin [Flavobacteriales bacterium]
MSYSVIPLRPFEKQLKRLAGKYPSLKRELAALVVALSQDPEVGTALGGGSFKIRLAIASKGKGKSGGGRVVTHVKVVSSRVYLLAIYDKSEKDTLSDKELDSLLRLIPEQ